MKLSKKKQRILNNLDEINDYLCYYMGKDHPMKLKLKEIHDTLEELALEQKEHNARFAKKLKWFWENENE